jgi:hypothetical protein
MDDDSHIVDLIQLNNSKTKFFIIYKKDIHLDDDFVHKNQLVDHNPLIDFAEILVYVLMNVIENDDVYDGN